MKKMTLLLLLATFVVTAGGHIHAIGSPGWGTGTKVGGSCVAEFTDSGIVHHGWTRTPWGTTLSLRRFSPRPTNRSDK